MDPSNPQKPTLPPLTTNIPPEEHGRRSVFARSSSPGPESVFKPERRAKAPTLLTDENLAPSIRYAPSKTSRILESYEEVPATRKSETKSTYYEEAFSSRGSHNSPRDRIIQDSVVIAELITSAKFRNHLDLMMDLSRHLALIYQRPEAAILLTLRQDAPLSFGNISLPAYLLKIYALPPVIAPTTNMRSTTMLATELQDLLGISPELGVILFIPVPHDNLATNGSTAGGEIAKLERTEQDDSPGIIRSLGLSISRRRFKSSSATTSAPISPQVESKSPSIAQGPQISTDEDIAVVEQQHQQSQPQQSQSQQLQPQQKQLRQSRRHKVGMKKSVQNFMRRGLPDRVAALREGDKQEDSDKVDNTESVSPKKQERVRFEDGV